MSVGIVVVSHSVALAHAAVDLALEMVHGERPPIEIAAGAIDGGLGTDATAVMAAIGEVDKGHGVVIFVDVGSALMSAELGVELYDDADADVRVLAAPFVEGIMAGVIKAAGGAPIDEVAAEAEAALQPKLSHLGVEPGAEAPTEEAPSAEAEEGLRAEVEIVIDTGLHARPGAMVVGRAREFDAQVAIRKGHIGPVAATSSIGLATLAAKKGDVLSLEATGPQAKEALDAVVALITSGFDETA